MISGGIVAHGVHVLLRGIDLMLAERRGTAALESVEARFVAPVEPGVDISYRIEPVDHSRWQIEVSADRTLLAKLEVRLVSRPQKVDEAPVASTACEMGEPEVVSFAEWEHVAGRVPLLFDRELAGALLPNVTACLPDRQTSVLLATTRIVGMHCPGLHSLFSELQLDFDDSPDVTDDLEFTVSSYDERFRLATIDVRGGGATGQLRAFERPKPQEQASVSSLAHLVDSAEFAGQRALVVGGSRGIGEIAAKLLATGGAEVCLTYRSGSADAQKIVEDILTLPAASARSLRFDATAGADELVDALAGWSPTRLLYFATPPIFRPRHAGYSSALYAEFSSVYVSAFADLFYALVPSGHLEYVLYPSSVAVEDTPRELVEYAVAKAAGETLCNYLSKTDPGIDFRIPRLPRLPTDQTANVFGIAAVDPVPLMLDLLR